MTDDVWKPQKEEEEDGFGDFDNAPAKKDEDDIWAAVITPSKKQPEPAPKADPFASLPGIDGLGPSPKKPSPVKEPEVFAPILNFNDVPFTPTIIPQKQEVREEDPFAELMGEPKKAEDSDFGEFPDEG